MDPISVRSHSTAGKVFTLEADGPFDLTSAVVHIVLIKSAGPVGFKSGTHPQISITDAPNGKVTFAPTAGFWVGEKRIPFYFYVVKAGVTHDFPSDSELIFEVRDTGSTYDPGA